MKRPLLFLLLLLCGVVVISWILLDDPKVRYEPREKGSDDALLATVDLRLRESALELSTSEFEDSSSQSDRQGHLLPMVEVVDEYGVRAVGATVAWYRGDGESQTRTRGNEVQPQPVGDPLHQAVVGAEGFAPWPEMVTSGAWIIVARQGGLLAQRSMSFSGPDEDVAVRMKRDTEEPIRLKLHLQVTRDLTVRVLDENGQGVADAVFAFYALGGVVPGPAGFSHVMSECVQSARTGPDGRARVRLCADGPSSSLARMNRYRFHVVQLGVDVVSCDVKGALLDQEIVLRVDGICRVMVRYEDRESDPARAEMPVLSLYPGQIPGSESGMEFTGLSVSLSSTARDMLKGWSTPLRRAETPLAIFRRGASVGWWLTRKGSEPMGGMWEVPDSAVGELFVRSGESLVTYTVEARDAVGNGVRGAWYTSSLNGSRLHGSFDEERSTWTFQLPPATEGELGFHAWTNSVRGRDPPPLAVVRPSAEPASKSVNRRRLELPLPPILVQGTVVDSSGMPVADVPVDVKVLRSEASKAAAEMARRLRFGYMRTDAEGNFVYRTWLSESEATPSWLVGTPLSIRVRGSGWVSEDVEFRLGDTVELRAQATGAIAGLIRVAPELRDWVDVYVSSDRLDHPKKAYDADHGVFEVAGLPAGMYSMEIKVARMVVRRLEGLEVLAGETLRPSMIADLDLETGFRLGNVKVVDVDGKAISGAIIDVDYGIQVSGITTDFTVTTNDVGEARIVIRDGWEIGLTVRRPARFGFVFDELHEGLPVPNPRFPLRVVLPLPDRVVLRLDRPLPASPGGGWHLLMSRPLGAAEMKRARDAAQKRRGSSVMKGRDYVQTHDDAHGTRIGLDPPESHHFRFDPAKRAGLHELRIAPLGAEHRGAWISTPLILGPVMLELGRQDIAWTLTEAQIKAIKAAFPVEEKR